MNEVYLNYKAIYKCYSTSEFKLFKRKIKLLRKLWDKYTIAKKSLYEKIYKVSINGIDYIVSSNGKVALFWNAPFAQSLLYDTPYSIREFGADDISIISYPEHSDALTSKCFNAFIPSINNVDKCITCAVCEVPSIIGFMGNCIDYELFHKIKFAFHRTVIITTYKKDSNPPILIEKDDLKAFIMPYTKLKNNK